MPAKRIVIVGGGFGGLNTALGLETLLGGAQATVSLLSRENFFLFTPMLPEVTSSSVGTRHIVSPLRKILRKTRVAAVTVEGIDLEKREVVGRHSVTGATLCFEYDLLVLALGGVTNYFGVPGAREHSMPIKTLGDAIYVRNHVIDMLEQAAVEPEKAEELLTFVFVGGGLTGVEVCGAINDFVREAITYYPEVERSRIRVALVEAGDRLMPEMNEQLATFAERVLINRGVEVMTQVSVTRVEPDKVALSTGDAIRTRSLVWAAGVSPDPLLASLDVPKDERGRIRTNRFLEVKGLQEVWALGDCASIPNPATGKAHPPTAQHAVREGKVLARNVAASLTGRAPRPFEFKSLGQMALVGERTGVADVMGHHFSGFFAWFLWRSYYLMRIPMFEKRLRVVMDWTLDLFFSRDLVQLAVTRGRAIRARSGQSGC